MKLYVGAWLAKGQVQATLGDGSAGPYSVQIDAPSGAVDKVVTLNFKAASTTTLTVTFTENTVYSGGGNITLQGATLVVP